MMNLNYQLRKLKRYHIRDRAALGLILLIVASYLGNYFRWSFFFNIDFLFGSIAVWIVVCLYGTVWGTVAAFIGGLCTYVIWNHPYSTITFTCEALFVSLLFHRQRQNIVLLDGIFWLFIGMPLVWLFYANILGLDHTSALIILFKQPVNGIFNALIASLMLTHLPIYKWVTRPQAISTLSLQQTLFNLLVAFVFFPTLMLMVLNSNHVVDNIKTTAQSELRVASNNLTIEIQNWHQQHLRTINELARIAAKSDLASIDILQQNIDFAKATLRDFYNIYVVNPQGSIVVASSSLNEEKNLVIGSNITNQPYFKTLERWNSERQEQSNNVPIPVQPEISAVLMGESNSSSPKLLLSVPVLKNNKLRGFVISEIELSGINKLLKAHVDQRDIQSTVVDNRQSVIASTQTERVAMQTFDRRQDGEVQSIAPGIYHWLPTGQSTLVLARWSNSFFVQETLIDDQLSWTLIVELAAKPHVHYIEKVHTNNLVILMVVSGVALIFAALLSRRLVAPLLNLAQVTTNLPNKLLDRELIDWPRSFITEIDSLVHNFKLMAASLNQKFREIKSVNEVLEQRVQERTQQLLKTNLDLESEISERKRTEEMLKAYTAKLELSNRELQDFAFVASHDLQEPLRKIQAFGDCLKLEYSELLAEEGQDYIQRMQKAAHRMQTLINDLLMFSRVSTKAQPFVAVDLTIVVHEVLSDLEVQIERVNGQVEVGNLLTIDADPLQMRQLLQNLISNALKFHRSEEAPLVKVWTQYVGEQDQLSPQDPARQRCQIMVEDNGIGFEEKYLDRIFTVFQRLHGRNEYEGTGVGLAICRKIVERHGGLITAKSTPEQGTTFIIELPVVQSN